MSHIHRNTSIVLATVMGLLIACGSGTSTPNPTPTPTKVDHEAWFENTESLKLKSAFVGTYNLGGLSVWSLGNDDASFWTAVAAGLPAGKIALGYLPDYARDGGFASVQQNKAVINMVSDFTYGLDAAGVVTGDPAPGLIDYGTANHIQILLCLVPGQSNADVHSIFTTGKVAAITNLVSAAKSKGYQGVNLDYEGFNKADRANYSLFVKELATALHAQSLKLVVSVPAKTSDVPSDDWSGGFDYASLGQDVDYLQMMTYDENGPGWSDPGPVAGADWMEDCIKFAVSVVPPAKVLIGLPAYGYDWMKDSNGQWVKGTEDGSFAFKDIPSILSDTGATPQWDDASKSAFIQYQK